VLAGADTAGALPEAGIRQSLVGGFVGTPEMAEPRVTGVIRLRHKPRRIPDMKIMIYSWSISVGAKRFFQGAGVVVVELEGDLRTGRAEDGGLHLAGKLVEVLMRQGQAEAKPARLGQHVGQLAIRAEPQHVLEKVSSRSRISAADCSGGRLFTSIRSTSKPA
jgi:hypothetical protein